jgi:hypothetical protein
MDEDTTAGFGSFSSSSWSEEADNVPTAQFFGAILQRFESLSWGQKKLEGIEECARVKLDDLLLHLRLWATDIKAETNSLDLLDRAYHNEAAAVRIHLGNVLSALESVEAEGSSRNRLVNSAVQV